MWIHHCCFFLHGSIFVCNRTLPRCVSISMPCQFLLWNEHIHMCVAHSYVWHDLLTFVTWHDLFLMCDMTQAGVSSSPTPPWNSCCRTSTFISMTWIIWIFNMTDSYVWHDSCRRFFHFDAAAKFLLSYQHILYYPVMSFARWNLYVQSWLLLLDFKVCVRVMQRVAVCCGVWQVMWEHFCGYASEFCRVLRYVASNVGAL